MKYLKKFNEELNAQTYFNAAKKLKGMGSSKSLTKRATDLEQWGERAKWKQELDLMSKFGSVKLDIKTPKGIISGDFYLSFIFSSDSFEDSYEYEKENNTEFECDFGFFVGIIPTTEELWNECLEKCEDPDQSNGFFWGLWVGFDFYVDGKSFEFKKIKVSSYDETLTGEVTLSDRPSANKFKNQLFKVFSDRDLNYPSSYNNHEYIYDLIEETLFNSSGITAEYGVGMHDVADFIKSVSPNTLL
jgi:hypothetical protein